MWREHVNLLLRAASGQGLSAVRSAVERLYAVWEKISEDNRAFFISAGGADLEAGQELLREVARQLAPARRSDLSSLSRLRATLEPAAVAVEELSIQSGEAEADGLIAENLLLELESLVSAGALEPDAPVPPIPSEPDRDARPRATSGSGSGLARVLGVTLGVGTLAGVGALADYVGRPRRRRRRRS